MQQVVGFLTEKAAYFIIGLMAVCLLLLVSVAGLSRRLTRISSKRGAKIPDGSVGEIVDCIQNHSESLSVLQDQINALVGKQSDQSRRLESCLQRVGIVRFDAFDDVGGEQSFAVALLDANNNGIVISNLYGRQDSRVYVKRVVGGACERAMSDEERKALDAALT